MLEGIYLLHCSYVHPATFLSFLLLYIKNNYSTVSYLETNEIKGPMPSELGKKSFVEVIDPERLGRRFFYLKLADTMARYKNRNLKPRNRIGRLKNRNSKRTDTIGRYKNRNLTSTDWIVRYNRKIESVSENRSIGPFAHLCRVPVRFDLLRESKKTYFFNIM